MGSSNSVVKKSHLIAIGHDLDITCDEDEETVIPGKVQTYKSVIKLRRISSKKDIMDLEKYFLQFRRNVVGVDEVFLTPYGTQKLVYCDWTASARLHLSVENSILKDFGRFVGNTHTKTSICGTMMTIAYEEAKSIIKQHVNAGKNDALIIDGTGVTGIINKFQRILGLRLPESCKHIIMDSFSKDGLDRPVVFVSHMEHHSNQTSWEETTAEVFVIPPGPDGGFSCTNLQTLLDQYGNSRLKIASITACSNVTGIQTPYYEVAKMMHSCKGYCFVDFACSGPYVDIDMHPTLDGAYLDAIFISPHKFLGGPGTPGIMVFNKKLYNNAVPDNCGGGTVEWTNPWGEREYIEDVEEREDGGTPGFLQLFRTALAFRLKDTMGIKNIIAREHDIVTNVFNQLEGVPGLCILAKEHRKRLAVFSFVIDNLHFKLGVKILNDKYGIQSRGGCSCAGTYGHYLLNFDREQSNEIYQFVTENPISKPGWIRVSFHPTNTNQEIQYVCDSIKDLAANHLTFAMDYRYLANLVEFQHKNDKGLTAKTDQLVRGWFSMSGV